MGITEQGFAMAFTQSGGGRLLPQSRSFCYDMERRERRKVEACVPLGSNAVSIVEVQSPVGRTNGAKSLFFVAQSPFCARL